MDHVPGLKAWADSFGGINYPLLSDFWPHGSVAKRYGVLRSEGYSERAIFIIDKTGVIRYIDIHDIDDQPDNEVLFSELARIDPQAASNEPTQPDSGQLPVGGIVVYCTKWCSDCNSAKEWLRERELDFVEVDIYDVPGAIQQVRTWGKGSVITPTFDIDGTIVLDFNKDKLAEVLERKT